MHRIQLIKSYYSTLYAYLSQCNFIAQIVSTQRGKGFISTWAVHALWASLGYEHHHVDKMHSWGSLPFRGISAIWSTWFRNRLWRSVWHTVSVIQSLFLPRSPYRYRVCARCEQGSGTISCAKLLTVLSAFNTALSDTVAQTPPSMQWRNQPLDVRLQCTEHALFECLWPQHTVPSFS